MGNEQSRTIELSRVFNFPVAEVFMAYTNVEALEQWWGPNGFTTTTHSLNFSVGGSWNFIMHGPDGTDYPNFIKYKEIVKDKKISFDHGTSAADIHFQTTVVFEDLGGKTKIIHTVVFPTPEACEAVKKFGAVEGGKQTLARLEKYLERPEKISDGGKS